MTNQRKLKSERNPYDRKEIERQRREQRVNAQRALAKRIENERKLELEDWRGAA